MTSLSKTRFNFVKSHNRIYYGSCFCLIFHVINPPAKLSFQKGRSGFFFLVLSTIIAEQVHLISETCLPIAIICDVIFDKPNDVRFGKRSSRTFPSSFPGYNVLSEEGKEIGPW